MVRCSYAVCLLPSLHSVRFGQMLRCAHKRIVNIMKVYIERSTMQVDLIRFRKKYRLYSRLRGERVPDPLYVYSLVARWQQLATNKLITIHSPDGSTPRYAHQNECILTVYSRSTRNCESTHSAIRLKIIEASCRATEYALLCQRNLHGTKVQGNSKRTIIFTVTLLRDYFLFAKCSP